MQIVHGTTVEIAGKGVLIRGASGSGKSDLALRLIDGGAMLVADDQTTLAFADGALSASPPATIAGLLEVRGLGLIRLPYRQSTPLALVVDLVATDQVERMPDDLRTPLLGVEVPTIQLFAFETSAAAKVRLAASCPTRDIIRS